METIGKIITPALTILLVGLILPMVSSSERKSAETAEKDRCISYGRGRLFTLKLLAAFLILLTLATIICTVLSIVDPQMMDVSSEDVGGIVFLWILCLAVDLSVILVSLLFRRKICYDDVSFTEFMPFRKPKRYLFSDITGITSTIVVRQSKPIICNGKLKIYFGKECVKIPELMYGVGPFIEVLHEKCNGIEFN